jgi:hypothetical protein
MTGAYPVAMTSRPAWVVSSAADKIPLTPSTRRRADVTNPATWSDFETARRVAEAHNLRVGYVFSKQTRIVGIDLDRCRNPDNGEIEPWAMAIVQALDSLTEISVSGSGLHIFCVSDPLPAGGRKKGRLEMYDSGRHFVCTGDRLPDYKVLADRSNEIRALHADTFPPVAPPKPPRPTASVTPLTLDTEAVLRRVRSSDKGRRLHDGGDWRGCGYPSQSEADQALANLFVSAGADRSQVDDLFRRSALFREKWDKRHYGDGRTYGDGTIDRAFDGSVRVWNVLTGPKEHLAPSVPIGEITDDLAELKQIIGDLTRRLEIAETRAANAERRADAAEARAAQLSQLQSKTMAVMRSKHLGNEKYTGIALVFELASQQSVHPDNDEFAIPYVRLAEQSGQHEKTVSDHIKKKLAPLGMFERRTQYTPERVDPDTGEIFPARTQSIIRPTIDPLAMLDALATAQHVSGAAKNGHGGKRPLRCLDHPEAGTIRRTTIHCAECDKVLDIEAETWQAPPAEDVAGPMEQVAPLVADPLLLLPQRGYVLRGSPERTYHNQQPPPLIYDAPEDSISAAWQQAQPMPGFEPPTPDRWTDMEMRGRP